MMQRVTSVILVIVLLLICFKSLESKNAKSKSNNAKSKHAKSKSAKSKGVNCDNDSQCPDGSVCLAKGKGKGAQKKCILISSIDECSSNPCQNGATCVDGYGSYSCNCQPAYVGPNCETDIDGCNVRPCLSCSDGLNGFTCLQGPDDANCSYFSGNTEGIIYLRAMDGPKVLNSPGYPVEYCNFMFIVWQISAPEGQTIEINFEDFHVENSYDFLNVTDGICCGTDDCTSDLGSFTGVVTPDGFNSTSNALTLILETDFVVTTKGFSLQYKITN